MSFSSNKTKNHKSPSGLSQVISKTMISNVPTYANKFFYSLGFLSMISFVLLLVTGLVMSLYGPNWWLTTDTGKFFRSVHLWSTQAFVLFIILHLIVVFCTSGFKKPRTLTWVLGVLMFFFVLAESEFGYILRGDFSSQWRTLQGADFYNGSGIGKLIDTLNYKQVYGIHLAVIPFMILGLLFLHYALVRVLGIANHSRKGVKAEVVPANHTILFIRGGVLVALILGLAVAFPSPFLKPSTIKDVAQQDPALVAKTLASEFDGSSDTAGYMDNINPYTYDIKAVYINGPYNQYLLLHPSSPNYLQKFYNLSETEQAAQLKQIQDYYGSEDQASAKVPKNEAMYVINALVEMASAGLYEPAVAYANDTATNGNQTTYTNRFLADTGVLEGRATGLNMTTEQYGMLREETSRNPVGAWWLAPIGVLNHTVLNGDENGDRDAAILFGVFLLLLVAFPYIPGVRAIPEKLRLYKLFQRQKP
jgi:hypothetical protein